MAIPFLIEWGWFKNAEICSIDRHFTTIEREAIKREKDKKKLQAINEQIANMRSDLDGMRAAWKNEKDVVDRIQTIKKEMEELELEAEKAERESEFEKVAQIRYGALKEKEAMLKVRVRMEIK